MSVEVAASNMARFGQYPMAMTFSKTDSVPDLAENDALQPAYSAAYDPSDNIKRHAACDECRKRKLKCSGEPTGCTRCVKQKLICHYSEQKQMGRPRKRQRTEDSPPSSESHKNGRAAPPVRPLQPATPTIQQSSWDVDVLDPSLSTIQNERANFENICSGPMARTVREQASAYQNVQPGDPSADHNVLNPDVWDTTSTTYPTDVAQWPDFSTLDMLPLPVEDKYTGMEPSSMHSYDPDANPEVLNNLPAIPACPCLPNLYLTLSTLSTLSSFPFTKQTINTIESSYKTSKGVIYCNVCPQKFDTGSSNLMLGTTLLNVLSDQWNRFHKLSVDDLRKAFGTPAQQNAVITTKEGRDWRNFQEQVIQAYVFGDQAVPHPPGCVNSPTRSASSLETDDTCSPNVPSLTLMGLCEALERRQKQWHRLEELTDEFPDRISSDLQLGHMVGDTMNTPGKHLCLEIVNHAKCMAKSLKTPIRR